MTGSAAPLSFEQHRLWLHDQLAPRSDAYHIPLHARLLGPLRPVALRQAINSVVARHEVLRTRYPVDEGVPTAVIEPGQLVPLPLVDLTGVPPALHDRTCAEIAACCTAEPFDLAAGPVLRAVLARTGRLDHRLILVRHHIACDGWSFGVLLAELSESYRAHALGEPPALRPLPIQYRHYAARQQDRDDHGAALDRWRAVLRDATPHLDMVAAPTEAPTRPAGMLCAAVEPDTVRRLRALAAGRRRTLFTALLTGFGLALGSLSGQRDIVVGSPVADRDLPGAAALIGCFVTMVALRVDLSGRPGLLDLVDRCGDALADALRDRAVPLERIVDALGIGRTAEEHPLFQAVLAYQNTPMPRIELSGLVASVLPPPPTTPKFPLMLTVSDEESGAVALELEFDERRVPAALVRELLDRTVTALRTLADDPHRLASAVRWADAPTATRQPALARTCLHTMFDRQVADRPDAVAVTDSRGHVSYLGLHTKAERLAAALRIAPETLVGICLPPSSDLIVAMLAVCRAGGAYVPVDWEDPARRRAAVLRDAGVTVVITLSTVDWPRSGQRMVFADQPGCWPEPARVRTGVLPDQLAYVIHTSGSTGRPKGVAVTHANVTGVLAAATAALPPAHGARTWSMTHSPAFDFAVWEIWGALLCGDRVVVVDREVARAADELWALLLRQQVDVLSQTPSAFGALLPVALRSEPDDRALSTVVFGGESCDVATLAPLFRHPLGSRLALVNMFGITETTVHVTVRRLTERDVGQPYASPIGTALAGQHVDVVDGDGVRLPVGGSGEILVGGVGVARGYLGAPGPTADRFRPDRAEPGGRRYHTGDVARVLDGDLDYVGRTDRQVKIRGYRIEPGEVEAAALRHPGVHESAVVVRHGGGDDGGHLVAYLVADHHDTAGIRRHLAGRLPRHLMPRAVVFLDRLPLTRNGKLDVAALPAPSEPDTTQAASPMTATERAVADLLAALLGWPSADRIGPGASFFDLGGDSTMITRFHFELMSAFGVDLSIRQVYQAPDIATLADVIDVARQREGL
jgi:nonribosomal peptide synthetase protein BlmVII